MNIRTFLSSRAGALGVRAYWRGVERGDLYSLPLDAWSRVPGGLAVWLGYRVFGAADTKASEAFDRIHPLGRMGLPPTDDWSISTTTRIALYRALERDAPSRMVEFGCGISTLIMADYAARHGLGGAGVPAIYSVEHEPHWLEETRLRLCELGLDDRVQFLHAPLEPLRTDGVDRRAYGVAADAFDLADAAGGFDLCFIDGPPHPVGREPCLDLIAPHLAAGATILLDDCIRQDELVAWRRWRLRYGRSLTGSRYILTDRGLAEGRWLPDSAQRPGVEEFADLPR